MSIRLDHTIVPAREKGAAAAFFADLFGLELADLVGPFAPVRINEELTLDFCNYKQPFEQHHYAFRVDEASFDAIFGRVKAAGLSFGSGPTSPDDGRLYHRQGGRGVYFRCPEGHLLELMSGPG